MKIRIAKDLNQESYHNVGISFIGFHLPGNFWDVDSRFVLETGGGANCRIEPTLIFGENLYCEKINVVIDDSKVRKKIQSSGLFTVG